jgi:putative ABC transport system permease protein
MAVLTPRKLCEGALLMLSVYLTLSLRYLRRRWFYALMIVTSIAAGVSLLVATRAINQTMNRAARTAATPLSGAVDLILSNGETPIDQKLVEEVGKIPGVATAWPRIFENVELPDFDNRTVLLVGIDVMGEQKDAAASPWQVEFSQELVQNYAAVDFTGGKAAIVGKSLDEELGSAKKLAVQSRGKRQPTLVMRVGTVDARGPAAALGGNVMIVDLRNAAAVLGLPRGKVNRIDLTLAEGIDRDMVRRHVERQVAGRADVHTPDEQNQSVENVMSGMQVALLLCGVAALVVGLFLVYNALSVSVAERRHEIGILLAVGATRSQIRRLFAGEAALLGLAGSLLGIPLGIGFAYVALEPVRGVLEEIFFSIDTRQVEIDALLIVIGLFAGVATAVVAALVPAIQASREKPAEAVRRLPHPPTWRHTFVQIASSAAMLLLGVFLVSLCDRLPARLGMYAGLGLVVVASLLATPVFTALAAAALQPLVRRFLGLEVRLAADNLIRAPGRTGIVIAALAAGVGLFIQTAGTIKSNRVAIRDWVEDAMAADLTVSSGSPVSAGGKSKSMDGGLAREIEKIAGVERALPVRLRKPTFGTTQVAMVVFDADDYYTVDSQRNVKMQSVALCKTLSATRNGAIISDNFAVINHVGIGDVIPLASPHGPVEFTIIGKQPDYSWNYGTFYVNRKDYLRYWDDEAADLFDVYLRQDQEQWAGAAAVLRFLGQGPEQVDSTLAALKEERKRRIQEEILKKYGAEHGLFVLTREELQNHIDGMIQRLYGIAYAQQFVVLFVAGLGVVTALLISVLQRRREMGLLRAIGASGGHVIRCVLAEAALMGLFGSVIGLAVGIPLEWFALEVVIVEESGYLFPLVVPWLEALLIAGAAIAVATLAGLGPALYAVRQRIPDAIAME